MLDKHFLIIDDDFDIEEKVIEFAVSKFSSDIINKIEVEIDIYFDEEMFTEELIIELKFKEFSYINSVHGKQIQSLMMCLENKGLQPFYDNGKFFTKNVYEWVSGSEFQNGVNKVYFQDTRKLFDEFNDYILTC